MYSLLTPIRVRRARRAAVAAISPMVERSRWRLGSISEQTWADPYIIGLVAMLITAVAHRTDSELDGDALGRVQTLAWQDLTGQNASTVGEDVLMLAQAPDADFVLGCQDALVLAKLVYRQDCQHETVGMGFPDMGFPDMNSADMGFAAAVTSNAVADASENFVLAAWSRCFDSHVTLHEHPLS